jgi:hypothetical protein
VQAKIHDALQLLDGGNFDLKRYRGLGFVFERDWVADANWAVAQDGGFESAAMLQRLVNAADAGNSRQMAAGLKEPDAAQAHTANGKLAVQQFDQGHTPGDNITPALLRERFDAQFSRDQVENFFFDEGYGLIGAFERCP